MNVIQHTRRVNVETLTADFSGGRIGVMPNESISGGVQSEKPSLMGHDVILTASCAEAIFAIAPLFPDAYRRHESSSPRVAPLHRHYPDRERVPAMHGSTVVSPYLIPEPQAETGYPPSGYWQAKVLKIGCN
jgi:hypothetical protein